MFFSTFPTYVFLIFFPTCSVLFANCLLPIFVSYFRTCHPYLSSYVCPVFFTMFLPNIILPYVSWFFFFRVFNRCFLAHCFANFFFLIFLDYFFHMCLLYLLSMFFLCFFSIFLPHFFSVFSFSIFICLFPSFPPCLFPGVLFYFPHNLISHSFACFSSPFRSLFLSPIFLPLCNKVR